MDKSGLSSALLYGHSLNFPRNMLTHIIVSVDVNFYVSPRFLDWTLITLISKCALLLSLRYYYYYNV